MSVEQESNQSECDSQNEYDSNFIKQEKSRNESDNEDSNFEPKPLKVAFIVCWSSSFWKPQPDCNRFSVGNLMSVAAVLFSANTYQRIASFFQLANIQWISRTSYYKIQKKIFGGIVNRNYGQHSKEILMTMKRRGNCYLSGDGRYDSPVHNAKYLTYSFMDKETGKIAAMSLIQVSEVHNSNPLYFSKTF